MLFFKSKVISFFKANIFGRTICPSVYMHSCITINDVPLVRNKYILIHCKYYLNSQHLFASPLADGLNYLL